MSHLTRLCVRFSVLRCCALFLWCRWMFNSSQGWDLHWKAFTEVNDSLGILNKNVKKAICLPNLKRLERAKTLIGQQKLLSFNLRNRTLANRSQIERYECFAFSKPGRTQLTQMIWDFEYFFASIIIFHTMACLTRTDHYMQISGELVLWASKSTPCLPCLNGCIPRSHPH